MGDQEKVHNVLHAAVEMDAIVVVVIIPRMMMTADRTFRFFQPLCSCATPLPSFLPSLHPRSLNGRKKEEEEEWIERVAQQDFKPGNYSA